MALLEKNCCWYADNNVVSLNNVYSICNSDQIFLLNQDTVYIYVIYYRKATNYYNVISFTIVVHFILQF